MAGCGIVRAPTAGANRILLEKDGLGGEVQAINTELVAAVKQAAGGSLTAGCLGPTGLQAEPHGDTPVTALIAVYAEQAKALRDAGCEVLLCEGMTSLNEARAALLACLLYTSPAAAPYSAHPSRRAAAHSAAPPRGRNRSA